MADYTIPTIGTPGQRLHGWLLEALQEGDAWLRAQQPASEWQAVLDLLAPNDQAFGGLSANRTKYNKSKRVAKEMVASLTNFRHEGEFKVDHDQQLYAQAMALTKLDDAWYSATRAYGRYREVMQYGVAFGTGYLAQTWDKHFHGPMKGDIRLEAFGPDDILFLQLPKTNDIQQAYAVLIRYELPINMARRMYMGVNQAWAMQLQPDRSQPGWLDKGLRKVQQLLGGSPVLNLTKERRTRGAFPTVDIFHMYTLDDSLNTSGIPREMGAYGTNWAYTVPSLGDDLSSGVRDPQGNPLSRKATEDDARLFPLRRLTIFSRAVPFPAYDGSSPWWHGKAPLARFRFNDWPWEALGQSLISDIGPMQLGIEAIMDDIEDSSHARLDPPIMYDDTHVSKEWANAVNPRKSGVRVAAPMAMQGIIAKVFGEQWQYEVPQWIMEYMKAQEDRMDYLSGTPDLIAIARAKQVPSESTLEKLLEMAGPLVQDMIRNVEEPLYDLGTMRLAYYFQFYTMPRILSISGNFGQTGKEFAFTPELIVPQKHDESEDARAIRIRRYLSEFKYTITQSSINEIHRLSTKLFYLQLMKAGFPISWWTFAEIAQIPNFGAAPTGTDDKPVETELEKWIAQKHMEAELQEELAQAANGAIQPGGAPAAPGSGNGTPSPSGNGGPVGRPPVNTGEARLVQKDGGTRSTVTTSDQ